MINRSEMRVKMLIHDAESREHKRFSAVSRVIQSILISTLIVLVVIVYGNLLSMVFESLLVTCHNDISNNIRFGCLV